MMLMMSAWCVSGWCTEVTLSWGVVTVDLKAITPKDFVGVAQVEQNKAANIGRVDFQLYKDQKSVNLFKEKHLFLMNKEGAQRELTFRLNSNRLTDNEFGDIVNKLEAGDSFICVLKDEDNNNYTVVVNVQPNSSGYIQPLFIPIVNRNHRFKYQLVTRYDGRQILKIDTTLEENKKIVDGYKRVPKVSIQHYPKFETVINYLSENDSTVALGKRNFVVHPMNKPTDEYLLVTTEPGEILNANLLTLDWNKMVAKPDSPIFAKSYLQNITNHSINLFADDKRYDIVSMRWTYLDGRSLNKAYYWKNGETYPLDLIKEMKNPFSIMIDRIVVKDSRLGYIYIPQAFMFNFQ